MTVYDCIKLTFMDLEIRKEIDWVGDEKANIFIELHNTYLPMRLMISLFF